MNKFIYIFVAIAAISFVSCTQERAKEKELKEEIINEIDRRID